MIRAFRSFSQRSFQRLVSTDISANELQRLEKLRNIGISAHIDSGKTTLTERILYYTGKIDEIHEVRGKDSVGAKMDSMDLEREKGITIQSAATYSCWKNHNINIIDTPGHVDFTIEVERALRVLDGAILVLCSVGGVQSQTMTVDRQMKRYNVPRIAFINKMDRAGANPKKVLEQLQSKLRLNAHFVQWPIGSESNFQGVVDLIEMKAYYNQGYKGNEIKEGPVPNDLLKICQEQRAKLLESVVEVNDEIADIYLQEEEPTVEQLKRAIRQATIDLKFMPVFMGSAYHNKSVQPMLDGVLDYLPAPHNVKNEALDLDNGESKVPLRDLSTDPLVSLAFKLEEGKYGQLTYMRVYQGTLRKGGIIYNMRTKKKHKIPRLVRMHSNEMEDVSEIQAGEICAVFGIECASGDTFTDGSVNYTLTTMFVPQPVVSLSVIPKCKESANFSKALARFQKEDPTFVVHLDPETKETIISGMGELHLEIYLERMRREYGVDTETGKPRVAFREMVTQRVPFEYTHKKQSGGSGQYAKLMGYFEPIPEEELSEMEDPRCLEFINATVGMNIPSQYIPAIEKGFHEACQKGFLTGHPIVRMRFVIEDGLAHAVDSSELAFKTAAIGAIREFYQKAKPIVLEPIMNVAVSCPTEFQGSVAGALNKRRGVIGDSEVDDGYMVAHVETPLNEMFGFSTELRSLTQGKGEFSMEYVKHMPATADVQQELIREYAKKFEKTPATGKKK